ncbi:MAG TPA: response regulator [Candidatus Angelobacter sp.]|nr:response regulator [Candidatus Angelobacter sp.]
MKKNILSISYDKPLLLTRQMLLQREGYEVTSALGFTAAVEACKERPEFDLILMGHSMPHKDKMAFISVIRGQCDAPLLSILRHGDPPIAEASYCVDSHDGPDALLAAVNAVLK